MIQGKQDFKNDNDRPMYEKRAWGEYFVLDYSNNDNNKNSLTKKLVINEGQHISYQLHRHRTEIWTFIKGEGLLTIDGVKKDVKYGDTVIIPIGAKHTVEAKTELHIIEVQIGDLLIEEDIERFDYEWYKKEL